MIIFVLICFYNLVKTFSSINTCVFVTDFSIKKTIVIRVPWGALFRNRLGKVWGFSAATS
jgi:hypothetical protein